MIFLMVPFLAVLWIGVINKESANIHLFAVKVSLMWFLYVYGEEFGWRGYLQESLVSSGNDYSRACIIGIIWYFWHLSFLMEGYSMEKEVFFFIVLVFGSFNMLKVVKKTESLATAIALHFSFSVLTNIPLPSNSAPVILFMCFIWLMLYLFWNKGILNKLP